MFTTQACIGDLVTITTCLPPYDIRVSHAVYLKSRCHGQGTCCPHSSDQMKERIDKEHLKEITQNCTNHKCGGVIAKIGTKKDVDYMEVHYICNIGIYISSLQSIDDFMLYFRFIDSAGRFSQLEFLSLNYLRVGFSASRF